MEFKMLLLKFGIIVVIQVQTVLMKGFTLEPVSASWEDASGVCRSSGHMLVPGRRYRAKAIRRLIADGQSVWLNGWRTISDTSPDNSGRIHSLKIDFSRAYKKEVKLVCQLESIFYDPRSSAVSSDVARDTCAKDTKDTARLADVLTAKDVQDISNTIVTDTPYWINSISPQVSKIKQCLVATKVGDDLTYGYGNCSTTHNFLCMRDDEVISTFSPVISLKSTRFAEFRQLIEEYEAAIASSSDTIIQPSPTQISLEPSPTESTELITSTETPVQTLSLQTPVQTLSSQTTVQTLSSQTPEQTVSSSALSTSYSSAVPMSSSSVYYTTTHTTTLETSSESVSTFDSSTTTTELSSAHTALVTSAVIADTVLSTLTSGSFLLPISATIEETIQSETSQITQSTIVDVASSSSSVISSESRSLSDSHQIKQYDTEEYTSSISQTIESTPTMSTTMRSAPPTSEIMPIIPSETTSSNKSDYEFLDFDSLYTQSTDSSTLALFSNVMQPTAIAASPSYKQTEESSAVLADDRSIIYSSSVYANISSEVAITPTSTLISGSATTGIILASISLESLSSSSVVTVMYESHLHSLAISASTSDSSIPSSSYGCMIKDYLTICPDSTSETYLQSSVTYDVQTTINMDTESAMPDMPISITPTVQITSTIQVDYDDDDKIDDDTYDDYEVDDNITSSTISDTVTHITTSTISDNVTPIYTINTSDSIMEVGNTTDTIDKEIKGVIDKDGMDDDEEGNASSDNQGGIVKQKKEEPKGDEETGLWIAFGILFVLVLVSLIIAYILYSRRNRQSKDITPVNGAATSGETMEIRDSRSPSRENGKPRESTTFKNHAYDV